MIPEITRRLMREMETQEHPRRITLSHSGHPLQIDVFPGVFPPTSLHSSSSNLLRQHLGILTGQRVLDIGCGTGIESIAAVLSGAYTVDAVDIEDAACLCTQHNASLNGAEGRITVHHGDIFMPIDSRKYDLIIANLPIIESETDEKSAIASALFDPGFKLHHRLLAQAKEHLALNGRITFTHANLLSAQTDQPFADFIRLESLIFNYGYRISARYVAHELGYRWICYHIQPKSHRWHRP